MDKKVKAKLAQIEMDLAVVQAANATEKQIAREQSAALIKGTVEEIRLKHERDLLKSLLAVEPVPR